MFLGLSVAALILVLDQASKYYVMHHILGAYALINYTSFFNLVQAWNTGVSFSMFNNWGYLGVIALSGVALTIVGFLVYWLYTEKSRYNQVALGFIIGGAIGNVIDRIRLGAVFDFLDFYVGDRHWPAFNLADSFICIGAFMIILYSLVNYKKEVKE